MGKKPVKQIMLEEYSRGVRGLPSRQGISDMSSYGYDLGARWRHKIISSILKLFKRGAP